MARKRFYRRGPAPRAPRPMTDSGTAELIKRRISLSPHDATLATCPLDVMKSRHLISDQQWAAASHFRAIRSIVFGSPHVKASDLLKVSGASVSRHNAEFENAYREAMMRLRKISPYHTDAAENLIVHEVYPSWMTIPDRKRAKAICMEMLNSLLRWHEDLPRVQVAA